MKLNRSNLVLALVLAFVVVMSAFVHVDYSRPNLRIVLGDDMTYSPAYGAYEPNGNFADGRTMQTPVRGAIARGMTPLHFEATPEDGLRAGEHLHNPYDPLSDEGRAAAQRGGEVFRIFCTACHGGGGAGDGPVAARGFPPPPSLLTGKSAQMKDGQLFHILTYGQGSMTSFAAQLTPDRRWDVINYVRDLQQQAAPSQASAAESTETETTPEPTDQETPDAPPVETDAAIETTTAEESSPLPPDTEPKS